MPQALGRTRLAAGTPRQPIVVIPARMASSRLPGKPLADIGGLPMIVHVYRRAVEAAVGPVLVACAEAAIADTVRKAGGDAVLTRPDHPSGSDRIFEAVQQADPAGRHDAVVNLQGDLPTVEPQAIRAVLAPLEDPAVDIGTIVTLINSAEERDNPNMVKAAVAFAESPVGAPAVGRALYFSRLPVPAGEGPHYHHIGIYAYRRAALARFVALPPGGLEKRERLEQLRALEAGMRIDAALVDSAPFGVDTPADLARARAILSPA
jgi:3-deoxy-manno-octulosonate cytidylyltransferase (CMP-KDO synthetase)